METFELAREKFRLAKKMMFDRESIEVATPEVVATYRAKRLACDAILDVGCGLGGDTSALAGTCGQVVAIDINPQRLEFARNNCRAYGRKNVQFVQGDVLKMNVEKCGAVFAFADPTRRVGGRRVKDLSETLPSTTELVKKLSGFKGFCIETSQQLNPGEIPYECECEYVSLDGELVCLSLYFGDFKKGERSAVVLPSGARLESKKGVKKPKVSTLNTYFYEIDPTVIRAGLVPELAAMVGLPMHGDFLTSLEVIQSPFFRNSFELLAVIDEDNLVPTLQLLGAKKVVLRGRIDPVKQLALKQSIESKLSGTKKLHVFLGDKTIVAKNLAIKE